jgi:hypothetical protein
MRKRWLGVAVGLGLLAGCGGEDAQAPSGGDSASGSKQQADCVAGGLDQFDEGGGDPFWQTEGRADFKDFIVATCRKADAQGLLDGSEPGPELQKIAGEVLLSMVKSGQVRDPR